MPYRNFVTVGRNEKKICEDETTPWPHICPTFSRSLQRFAVESSIGVNSYLAQGLIPPLLWSWGSPIWRAPHFCDVIFSKLCFNCLHCFYAMLTNRQLDHSFPAVLDILRKGRYRLVLCTRHGAPNSFCRLWSSCLEPPTYFDKFTPMESSTFQSIEASASVAVDDSNR